MKKVAFIIKILIMTLSQGFAQNIFDQKCDSVIKSQIIQGIFFDNNLYKKDDYKIDSNIKCLNRFKLIDIFKSNRFLTDDHNTWYLYGFVDGGDCRLILPDTLAEVNQIISQEPTLTKNDIAFICSYFIFPYRDVIFLNNKMLKKHTAQSVLFHTIYSSNYQNRKLTQFNQAMGSYVFHKDYYKLMHKLPNDTSMQLVLSLNRQEYSLVSKKIENKRFEIQNRFYGTSILVTVIFNKDNTVKEVRKKYFIPKTKKFKNKGMYFYDSLESLLANEQD